MANGTDALELALRAVGVAPGGEVVLPANTFIATAQAVARTGARVVLADVDPDNLPDVRGRRGHPGHPRHPPGTPVRAARSGRAVGRGPFRQRGDGGRGRRPVPGRDPARPAGTWGIAAISFYPGKNLGAYGDAGAVVSTDEGLARTVRTLANHGGLTKYVHDLVGCNSRLDGLQAVVLRAKLARLGAWNAARRAAAQRYDALLAGLDVVRPVTLPGNEHVWHLYVIQMPGDRDAVVCALNEAGIGAAIHYRYRSI